MERDGKVYVNEGQEEQMAIEGFRLNKVAQTVMWIGYLLTGGLLHLFFFWLPHLRVRLIYSPVGLAQAEVVVLQDALGQKFVCKVRTITKEGTCIKIKKPHRKFLEKKRVFEMQRKNPEADSSIVRYFTCRKLKYIWDTEIVAFRPVRGLDEGHHLSYFHSTQGLTLLEQAQRRVWSGPNLIEVHVTPILKIFFNEVLSPFYVFQVFSMAVWYSDEYEIYATCILLVSSISICLTIYQTRTFERALRNTITSTNLVTVCRGQGEYEDIEAVELVPGDVIEIPRFGCDMPCDAVLVTGNCIVNESMLTGESVPVTKTSLPNPSGMEGQYDPCFTLKQHSRHVLFCGTHVIQTRFYGEQKVKAVVLRTGFSTSKGELVRSIMFPKPVDFKFQRHSYYFILFLAFLAGLGFIYTIIIMVNDGDDPSDIVLRTLDLITIAVPPALPAALSVGVVFSQRRLKHKQVYCISPKGINICGTIDTVCFDKTGTLTEDGLDMQGVVKVNNSKFDKLEKDVSSLESSPILSAMACCHSLTIIQEEIMGDPLDLIMFEATQWVLEEPGPDETRFDVMVPTVVRPKTKHSSRKADSSEQLQGDDVGIVRQFPFSSSLQRMSVITRRLGAMNFDLYAKGSPEMITSLSKPETVPYDFHDKLQSFTKRGYRVIALAWKPLPTKLNFVKVQRINREAVETDLTFLGLLVMENRVKPQTAPVIADLNNADIRTVMVTGDNMLTALSVSRECGMLEPSDRVILVQAYPPTSAKSEDIAIDFVYADDKDAPVEEVVATEGHRLQIDTYSDQFHFAMTGKTWAVIRQYQPQLLDRLVVKGLVFARMSPDQKGQLIETLQSVGYYVGMCGDGANDCGALKAAHMGISLSEAEASVASPFTSKIPTIECVPNVVKEGRAALVTSFGVFKYIACYSLTQFVSVLILYWVGTNLTDGEFMYVDFFLITSFSITFSRTGPYEKLVKDRPLVSLLSPSPIISIITQIAICTAAQTLAFWHVAQQPWFLPYVENEEEELACHRNTAVFLMSSYLYIVFAVSFSKGAPFRQSIFTNWWMLGNLAVAVAANIWITMYPTDGLAELMEMELFPSYEYRAIYIGVGFACFLISFLLEKFIVDNEYIRHRVRTVLCKCVPEADTKYQAIQNDIDNDPNWPPVSDVKVDLAEIFQRLDTPNHIPTNDDPSDKSDGDNKTLPDHKMDTAVDTDSITDRHRVDSSSGHSNGHPHDNGNTSLHPNPVYRQNSSPLSTETVSTRI